MDADARTSIRICMAIWAAAMGLVLAVSVWAADGRLIYALDDPYIHLAVAENILRGGYGVNATEFSSPSSSILYPFLLALTEGMGLGEFGPLVLTLLAAGLASWLTLTFLFRSVFTGADSRAFSMPAAVLVLLTQSAVALPLTGMEHSLHVLAAVAAFTGLVRLAETGTPSLLLMAAIVAMPLIRFEGLAYSAGLILVLASTGHARAAAGVLAALGLSLAAYAGLMVALGLPVLPSSVSLKSAVASSIGDEGLGAIVGALAANFRDTIGQTTGLLLLAGLCTLVVLLVRGEPSSRQLATLPGSAPHSKPERAPAVARVAIMGWLDQSTLNFRASPSFIVAAPCSLAISGHVLAGDYGWFHRYEVYIVAITTLTLLYLFRDFPGKAAHPASATAKVVALALLAMAATPYAYAAWRTPAASRGIHDQQFQMHRFVTEFWREPVAVNDLGLASYRNDRYVLDLWGLGSEEVRISRMAGNFGPGLIGDLVRRHDVSAALVYRAWFGADIPADWKELAVMGSDVVAAPIGEVHIYATDASRVQDLCEALGRFADTLPRRVTLDLSGCSLAIPAVTASVR